LTAANNNNKSVNYNESRSSTKIEKWSDIISQSNIDISKSINYVTAKQIKQITNEDARLMAKIDRIEKLPKIFKENSLFLLPISRKEYAIVRGTGYHLLEVITSTKPITYTTYLPFPASSLKAKSEGVILEYANSCGLLGKVTRTPNLIQTFRGRTTTPKFTFNINGSHITGNHAQIEVDAGFENFKEIILFEAKIGIPSAFGIRQLYYPFRTAYHDKKKAVRNFFLCLTRNGEKRLYSFWEYRFDPYDSFESIELVGCKQYQIKVSRKLSVSTYQNVRPIKSKREIPQADDVNKIIEFPLRVFEGYDTAEKIKDSFGFVNRQSSYYRQASEILGLVSRDKEWRYRLTDRGEEFLRLPSQQKSQYICKLLLEFPIINDIFLDVSIDRNKVIGRQHIIGLLKKYSDLTGSTLGRRTQTLISWFKWIRNNVGIVEVDKNGEIRISKQTRLP
jgi:Domain of unknown function (DUF6997)/Domain of unknown function (DUF6996)